MDVHVGQMDLGALTSGCAARRGVEARWSLAIDTESPQERRWRGHSRSASRRPASFLAAAAGSPAGQRDPTQLDKLNEHWRPNRRASVRGTRLDLEDMSPCWTTRNPSRS